MTAPSRTGIEEEGAGDKRLLRLHPADNVLTAICTIPEGASIRVEAEEIRTSAAIPLGFKVSARPIEAGARIMKYGVPIGSATCFIAAGEIVHTHNLKSDYLPTFRRGEGELHAR